MIKEHIYPYRHLSIVLDLLLSAISVPIAFYIKNNLVAQYFMPSLSITQSPMLTQWIIYIFFPLLLVFFLYWNNYYNYSDPHGLKRRVLILLPSVLETIVIIMAMSFIFSSNFAHSAIGDTYSFSPLSLGVLILLPFLSILLLWIKDVLFIEFLKDKNQLLKNRQDIIIVSSSKFMDSTVKAVKSHPLFCVNVVAVFLTDKPDDNVEQQPADIIREFSNQGEIIAFIEKCPVDAVLFSIGDLALDTLASLFEQLAIMGIKTQMVFNHFKHPIGNTYLAFSMDDSPSITYSPTDEMRFSLFIKECFDRLFSFILLILLSPLFLLLYLLIKITSPKLSDPAFFGQIRCGKNGNLFTLWKFRSMRIGADQEKSKLINENIMQGPTFKMKNDPRITPIGKLLRKTSLDELPQIWNVFLGDMSFVGPRPPLPSEVAVYDRWQRRRLSMKPGITCLWQVMGRNQLTFDTWMRLDLQYIDNWSLWLDIKILFRTIYVVFTGYGAM